jgi:hypothetical protein
MTVNKSKLTLIKLSWQKIKRCVHAGINTYLTEMFKIRSGNNQNLNCSRLVKILSFISVVNPASWVVSLVTIE